jgi:hypothetical protein
VPDAEHFFHSMGNVHDGHARGRQAFDCVEELRGLTLAERGRGLVHDQDARLVRQRASDLHHLLLRQPQAAYRSIRIQRHPEPAQYSRGITAHPRPVENAGPPGGRLAQEHVLRDAEMRDETELLIDGADAELPHAAGIAQINGRVVEEDLAGIAAHGTAEDLHQGGFAGAVLAQKCVHFARPYIQRGVSQRLDAGVLLADAAHLQQR